MTTHVTIERKSRADSFLEQLQQSSISQLQKLCGEIWTDYNLHDPGVTVLEQLNYALWELDYRLQFDFQDYLAINSGNFDVARVFLHSPKEIFSVAPVTIKDYRILMVSTIDEIQDVKVIANKEDYTYDFVLDVFSDTPEKHRQRIINKVVQLFHANRNLCENLGKVMFSSPMVYELHVEVEVTDDTDSSELFANIYHETQLFLETSIEFKPQHLIVEEGLSTDDIYGGPEQKRMYIDADSMPEQGEEKSVADLYAIINRLEGVVSAHNLYLTRDGKRYMDKLIFPDLYHSFTLEPYITGNTDIKITKDKKLQSVDRYRVKRFLDRFHYSQRDEKKPLMSLNEKPHSSKRILNKFLHEPIANGMPDCYGVNERGLAFSHNNAEKQNRVHQFKAYLSWFDDVMNFGLGQLNSIGGRINGTDSTNTGWADMLDDLYGEDSRLEQLDRHGKAVDNPRFGFLSEIASYGKNRGLGMNLLDSLGESTSGLEIYVKRLLGIKNENFDFFLIEHPLFYYGMSKPVPKSEIYKVSVIYFATDEFSKDEQFKELCSSLLTDRLPAHIVVGKERWRNMNELMDFKADFQFWKYMLSTQRKLAADVFYEKITNWLNN